MNYKKFIRIWLYPFNQEQKGSYHIPRIGEGGIRAVLTKNHLDILIDDSKELDDNIINELKKTLEIFLKEDWGLIIFQHHSTKKDNTETKLKQILTENYDRALSKEIITITSGNEHNSSNYAALYEAVQYYLGGDSKNLKGEVIEDNKRSKFDALASITYTENRSEFDEITESEPEIADNWKEFFENIKGAIGNGDKQIIKNNHRVWAFVKRVRTYQLINLNKHFPLFEKQAGDEKNIFDDTPFDLLKKLNEEGDKKLNIILAPGDLSKREYAENLFKEILQQKVINIDDSDSDLYSNIKANIPLLLICNNLGKETFYNSSVWQRAVSLKEEIEDNGGKIQNARDKYTITAEIKQYIDYLTVPAKITNDKGEVIVFNDYYSLNITREFFEYNTRLYKNSYLTGPHTAIEPVLFHSEIKMESKFKEEVKEFKSTLPSKLENDKILIKVLLIDDYGDKKLHKLDGESTISKKDILEFFNSEVETIGFDISVEENDFSTDKIIQKINEASPDIILLDYSLSKERTGVQLLSDLINDINKITHKGPFDKLWVFPITSFSNAFIDELRMEGITFNDENYVLSRGADFINTPWLFKYYFLKMVTDLLQKASFDPIIQIARETIEKFKPLNNWKEIQKSRTEFSLLYHRFIDLAWYMEYINLNGSSKGGIISSMSKMVLKKHHEIRVMNVCRDLLYQLSSRNYENNEELVILSYELKSELSKLTVK